MNIKKKISAVYFISAVLFIYFSLLNSASAYKLYLGDYVLGTSGQTVKGFASISTKASFNDNLLLTDTEKSMEGGFSSEISSYIGAVLDEKNKSFYFIDQINLISLPSKPDNTSSYYTHRAVMEADGSFLADKLNIKISDKFSQEPLLTPFISHSTLVNAMQLNLASSAGSAVPSRMIDIAVLSGETPISERINSESGITNVNRFSINSSYGQDLFEDVSSQLNFGISRTGYAGDNFSDKQQQNLSLGITSLFWYRWTADLNLSYSFDKQKKGRLEAGNALINQDFNIVGRDSKLGNVIKNRVYIKQLSINSSITRNWTTAVVFAQTIYKTNNAPVKEHRVSLNQKWNVTNKLKFDSSLGYSAIASAKNDVTGLFGMQLQLSRWVACKTEYSRVKQVSKLGNLFKVETGVLNLMSQLSQSTLWSLNIKALARSSDGNKRFESASVGIVQQYKSNSVTLDTNLFIEANKSKPDNASRDVRGGSANTMFIISEGNSIKFGFSLSQVIFRQDNSRSTDLKSEMSYTKQINEYWKYTALFERRIFADDIMAVINRFRNNVYYIILEGSIS